MMTKINYINQNIIIIICCFIVGCASKPPTQQHNLCSVFDQYPKWYDYAKSSEKKWGVPPHILMSFVRHESSYRHNARPPYDWFLFIPLGRPSSAKGYAQIQDPAWEDYKKENSGFFKSRSDMEDALDFIGWYNNKSNKLIGIAKTNTKQLYLAYHEGHTGYKRQTYLKKPDLINIAERVETTARQYAVQLRQCETEFKCRSWYEVGPFCR